AKMKASGGDPKKAATPSPGRSSFTPQFVELLRAALAQNPGLAKEVNAVVERRVADPDSGWTLDFSGDAPQVQEGLASGPRATVTLSDSALEELATGGASLARLFQTGAMRVDGDLHVARRLQFLQKLSG
ncbi:MAG: SCP2 sterol-binding domain-containing protein, partial [Myxococcota bacterium]